MRIITGENKDNIIDSDLQPIILEITDEERIKINWALNASTPKKKKWTIMLYPEDMTEQQRKKYLALKREESVVINSVQSLKVSEDTIKNNNDVQNVKENIKK